MARKSASGSGPKGDKGPRGDQSRGSNKRGGHSSKGGARSRDNVARSGSTGRGGKPPHARAQGPDTTAAKRGRPVSAGPGLIEGRNAVREALRANVALRSILIATGTQADASLDEIEQLARAARISVRRVPKGQLDDASERGAHQGVMAETAPFVFTPLADILSATASDAWSMIVVLDHVTDPGNLGAIARTAEVAGASALVVPRHRSAAVTAAAWKASAGALAHLPIAEEANVARALESLKEAGYWVAGASEKAESVVWDAPLEGRIALVLGAEGEGLSRLARERCDFLVKLPQSGKVSSLNVGQAATALIYEWVRRRELAGS